MKHILIIAPRLHNNLHYRVISLKNAGYRVSVLVWRENINERRDAIVPEIIGYSKIYQLVSHRILKRCKNEKIHHLFDYQFAMIDLYKLRKRIKYHNPDVIIVRGTPSISVFFSLLLSKWTASDLYMFIQTQKHNQKGLKKKIALFIIKKIFKVKAIITPIRNHSKPRHPYFYYIPFVIDQKEYEKTYFNNDRINIISIGKFSIRKDHLLLLKAFKSLRKSFPLSLTIVGDGLNDVYWIRINEFIIKHNMSDCVIVLKNIDHESLLELYRGQDLFVLPSYNEPAAFTPLEAMINKLPVVVSDSCGTSCYIKPGVNGYIFKSRNCQDLTDTIYRIISDKNRIIEMGNRGYEMVKTYHSLDVYSNRIRELIDYTTPSQSA